MVFPDDLLWGVSLSGFQFEMGDPAGRGIDPNTDWYAWVHDPLNMQKGVVSGDLPENSVDYWNLYKEDHKIAESLGLNAYRIGIEWSRIFPKSTSHVEVGLERGTDGRIARIEIDDSTIQKLDEAANKDALRHYREIIKDLRARGFTVFLCLNHFTLPLWVHDPIGVRDTKLRHGPRGWVDEQTVIEFTKYAAYLASKLGDIADRWATFNEPTVVSEMGYMIPQSGFPPGLVNFKASSKAGVHMVVAHARAFDAIKEFDKIKADADSLSPADVGVIHAIIPVKPLNVQRESDVKAAEFLNHMHNHFFTQAAVTGWLDENLSRRKERGEMKNYLGQRLDWLGVNYYSRAVVKGKRSILARLFAGIDAIPEMAEGYGFGCGPNSKSVEGMPTSDFGAEIYPQGIIEALETVKGYGEPMYITEHGIADAKDLLRPRFLVDHLKLLEGAIEEGRFDLRGYFHWALIDNYEWARGFRMKFGLFAVDLKTKKRVARKSANIYKKIVAKGKVTSDIEKDAKA